MNTTPDFDRHAAAWLADGPTELNDRVLDAALREVHLTHQRRRPTVPWRIRTMNPFARIAVAAFAVVAALVGAIYVLAPGGGVGGRLPATASPSGRPSPSPLVTASPTPIPTQLASTGDIFPGTYVPQFDPAFTFRIDSEVQHNCAPGYQCRGNIDANSAGWIYLEFGLPAIEFGMVRVDKLNDPAHSGRLIDPPADLAAWIASRPGLTVIAQKAVTVGGLAGTQLDVRTGTNDVQFGPIPGVTDPANGLSANSMHRLFVVTVRGRQILIGLVAGSGSVDELQPLVDSIVWN
jgi:hypothetical protein